MRRPFPLIPALAAFASTFFQIEALPVTSRTASAETREILERTGFQGGLVVLVDWPNDSLAIQLGGMPGTLVHALTARPGGLEKLRKDLLRGGGHGGISSDWWDGRHLPYVDRSVNLILIGARPGPSDEEILRCLAPGGRALIREEDREPERILEAPWPVDLDDWSHCLYDASNNAANKRGGKDNITVVLARAHADGDA